MKREYAKYILLVFCIFSLVSCKKKTDEFGFEDDSNDMFFEVVDEQANEEIKISKEMPLNQEFSVDFKTYEPDGLGMAMFKAKSIKVIDTAGERTPSEGNKLVLVEIAVKGSRDNKGMPSTFNQIGDYPSPQFVLINKDANTSLVEDTYYSDGYTEAKKLFELSKITMDHETWVNTAIVFEIPSDDTADLAFRFTNKDGQVEFYDINEPSQ